MTSKLNLFVFIVFLGVIGLNYQLSSDGAESKKFNSNSKQGRIKSNYEFAILNPAELHKSQSPEKLKAKNFKKLKADSLSLIIQFK